MGTLATLLENFPLSSTGHIFKYNSSLHLGLHLINVNGTHQPEEGGRQTDYLMGLAQTLCSTKWLGW